MIIAENSKNNDKDSDDYKEIPVINIESVEWLELKNVKEKVMDTLWLHEMHHDIKSKNKENQSLDPPSVCRVFQNLPKLSEKMKPKDLMSYLMGLIAMERFHRGGKEWRKYVLGIFRIEQRGIFFFIFLYTP